MTQKQISFCSRITGLSQGFAFDINPDNSYLIEQAPKTENVIHQYQISISWFYTNVKSISRTFQVRLL